MTKAILFDLYNTLAYIAPEDYRAAKKQMATIANVPEDLFMELWRQYSRSYNRGDILTTEERVAYVLRDSNKSLDLETIRKIADIEYKLQESSVSVGLNTIALLTDLKKMGLKLGLVSNTGFSTSKVAQNLKIQSYFDTIILSYMIRSIKPGEKIYQTACSALGINAHECLYVGDGDDSEIEGAMSLGMKTVLLDEFDREKILHTKVVRRYDYKISSLLELKQIVMKP
jgi:putative hydrolase of the HAD superfamily